MRKSRAARSSDVLHRRLADPVELAQDLARAGIVTSVLTAARAANGPRAAAHVEAGARAVGVALLLAQVHVEPRVEQAAEDRAHHRHGVEVRVAPRQGRMPDPDLGLDGARPVDDVDEPAGDGRGVVDAAGRRRRRVRRPVAEQPLDLAHDLVGVHVAGDHDRARGRDRSRGRGPRAARRGVRPSTVSARAARGPVVRARRRVDRGDVRLVGAAARIGLRLEEVGQALVAEPVDLALRERRPAHDLREQLERGRRAGSRARRARRTSRPSRPRRGATRRGARRPRSARWRRATSVPSVSARAARTVAPPSAVGLVGRRPSAARGRRDQRAGPASA